MSELQNIIRSKYDNDWIALSSSDKIFQLTNLISSQKNHYGFKPQGLWLGKGDNWLQYIKDNDMTDLITEYCSAFAIELDSNILTLKDKEDYVNFTKRYSKNSSNIKWEVVAKKYDGIIAYAPRRFAFDESLSWTYGWDITSACIWNSEGIKDIDEILNGCNDESFERGGKIHFSYVLINKDELLNKYNQVHENLFSHHSTIEYKPKNIKGLEVGKQINLKITGRLTNDKLDVLLVDNPYSKNKYPHITLSTAKGVKPVASNFEIENNLDKIVPLNDSIDGEITISMFEQGGEIEDFKKGGSVTTWKNKYNKKYGYPKNESHSLKEISKDTGVSMKGIRQIYNKGIGAYKTNPSSVRPNVTSKEQWAYARVYSSVMGGKASRVDAKELKMETGGLIKGSELIQKVSNYGSREGSDMVEFANENINPQFDYVLTEIKISELINNDKDLASFVDEVIDNPTMYSDVTEFENPNTHLMPILINDKGLVADGYGRIANSVYNDFNKVFAYVPNDFNKYKQGGKLFDKRKKEFLLIAEGEKKIKNSKRGYDKYLTILKDLKNGLKKDKEIELIDVFLDIQNDIKKYDRLVKILTPIKEKTTEYDNTIRIENPNLKIYPYTIDELNDVFDKTRRNKLTNSFEQGGILNNPNFKSWFGDSKVVDENGNPLVVYNRAKKRFTNFDSEKQLIGWLGKGFYFSTDKDEFKEYGRVVLKVYLSIQNPFYVKGNSPSDVYSEVKKISGQEYFSESDTQNVLIQNGYDGIIFNHWDRGVIISCFEPTQIKSAIGNSGEYDPNNPSIIMAEGGEVCTYDFDGYDLAKKICGNDVDVYLIPAEYKEVGIHLFNNHFPLWLYYNYLARIVISKEDVFTFKKQCLEEFKIDNPVRLLVKPFDDKYWKKVAFGIPRSYMGYSEIEGIIQKLEISLVQNGSWANKFKERTSGLTLPNPRGVLLNTVIHEFAHLIDVVRYNDKNPNEKILVTHKRGFLIALTDVLIACKREQIKIVSQVDNKALIIQKALQKPSFVERYKDTYGLNVFDGSVPKDLKEYDERFASLKGSKLNKEQAKELFDLIKKYQDEVLMGMAMMNPNKANRLFKSTNDLLTELKKYS